MKLVGDATTCTILTNLTAGQVRSNGHSRALEQVADPEHGDVLVPQRAAVRRRAVARAHLLQRSMAD